jgi:proline iminopeptidase
MVTEEFLALKDLKIYTKRMGYGVPLVFLHGGPGGEHRYFLPHLEGLEDTYELIFYDQRGCGQSEEPSDKSYTIEGEIEILEELRKSFGIGKLNLVGESWGSMLALLYASKYPKHVNKIFMTAAVGVEADGYLQFGKLLQERLSAQDKETLDELLVKLKNGEIEVSEVFKIIDPYYLYNANHLSRKTKTNSNADVNRKLGQEIIHKYNDYIKPEALSTIPIMVVQGDSDIITPEHLEDLFIKKLPHTQLKILKNCGHWSVIEQPEALSDLIKEFFGQSERKG